MFCPKCGNSIPDGVRFCPKCGTAISGGERGTAPERPSPAAYGQTATAVKEKPPKKKQGKLVLIAAALVVAAAVLLFQLFGGSGEKKPQEAPTPASDQTAELLVIIDEAEEARNKTLDEWVASEEQAEENEDDVELFMRNAQILSAFLTELEGLSRKADAVSGLEARLTDAGEAYFTMLHDSVTSLIEVYRFIDDYLVYYSNSVLDRPVEVDYDSLSDYAQALNAWLTQTKEEYGAVSYPSSVANEWAKYGEILDYNASIAQKAALAANYQDELRHYSATNLTNRYMSAEDNQYRKLLDCLEAESDHAMSQWHVASDLAEEMHSYAEKTPGEQEKYEFENIRTGEIWLNYDVVDTIYPSLYNTYDAFAIIKTGCVSGRRTVVVEAEIEGFTQKYKESFDLTPAYQAIYIKPPAVTGELDLSSAKSAQLKITVTEKDGTLIDVKSFPVNLKSKYDFEWYSDEYGVSTQDNILCFLTPEADAIARLKRAAIDEISDLTGNTVQSFVGYQPIFNSNYGTTYIQVAGLMRALYEEMGVRYNMNPFSISGSNQHIQLPENVITSRSGLCIETSLVIASALQSANMHAFLIFPPGHAMVAVEVWNSGASAGEYFLIETTALDSSNTRQHFVEQANALLNENKGPTGIITYYSAKSWANYLKNNVEYIVDCDDARLLGMTPFTN